MVKGCTDTRKEDNEFCEYCLCKSVQSLSVFGKKEYCPGNELAMRSMKSYCNYFRKTDRGSRELVKTGSRERYLDLKAIILYAVFLRRNIIKRAEGNIALGSR